MGPGFQSTGCPQVWPDKPGPPRMRTATRVLPTSPMLMTHSPVMLKPLAATPTPHHTHPPALTTLTTAPTPEDTEPLDGTLTIPSSLLDTRSPPFPIFPGQARSSGQPKCSYCY